MGTKVDFESSFLVEWLASEMSITAHGASIGTSY